MTKVLFLLSAVVMVIAGFFSFKNRDTFIQTRKEREVTVNKINDERQKMRMVDGQNATLKKSIADMVNKISTQTEQVGVANITLKNTVADAERLNNEVTVSQGKIKKYREDLQDLPKDVNLETINEDVNKLKQAIADAQGQATKIQEEVVAKEGEVKKTQVKLDGVVEKIESRKKLFERNSMSATIVAVNNDWGFVVIDGGENKGITVDTKLLVTRGQETIGRLNIIDVNGNRTVANIDQKSIRPGNAVAPGDRVILETLYQ